ncbi:MAG: PAS domain S-box protein [Devosiaceae bacterium]|nr:PAS domain S-box protein [Devosiaceae bacterium]
MIATLRKKKRAAWLWDGEGETLVWRNEAARLFAAKQKHGRLKLAKSAIPIPGQIRRLLRLGSPGITSLARVRFLVGSKPVSATCSCTPLELESGQLGMMIVGVDPIKSKLFKLLTYPDPTPGTLFNAQTHENTKGRIQKQKKAGNTPSKGQLSKLVEQLSVESNLFDPLVKNEKIDAATLKHKIGKTDKFILGVHDASSPEHTPADVKLEPWRIVGENFAAFDTPEKTAHKSEEPKKIVARPPSPRSTEFDGQPESQRPVKSEPKEVSPTKEGLEEKGLEENRSKEEIDLVAEYNFAELSRILEDKVGAPAVENAPVSDEKKENVSAVKSQNNTINLSEEVLVLNRLPVGLLIFRDQDILFANRALADLVGTTSISKLKSNGLAAIFPRVEDSESALGPVLSIIDAKGETVNVQARLQGITWQGRSALMLSAQAKHDSNQGTASIQSAQDFVRSVCEARDEGYFETDRRGVFTEVSPRALQLLGHERQGVLGHPIRNFIAPAHNDILQTFLEKPAKTAHTCLPFLELESGDNKLGFELFTHGSAGVVKGYFGAISPLLDEAESAFSPSRQGEVATLLLARLSRGIRRPLNTIMGFSELIGAQSFGEIENQRYVEYARDIKNAGEEISQLTDELDEYARLEDAEFTPAPDSFNLTQLLDECMGLVRNQANRAQVFIRSSISEYLPYIMADRASLRQAILNVLASAIAQTPAGGKVILSAQIEDDGSVGVHVRDSSSGPSGVDDRFMVFREKSERGKETMVAMKSSMGLALTRSLVSINSCALHVDPSAGTGTLMSLVIPGKLLEQPEPPATN